MHLDNRLDHVDRNLLNLVQGSVPLTREPYVDLGAQLSVTGDEVIARLGKLKTKGLIRQISPVIDAASLGFRTTLVAMRVTGSNLEKAEEVISGHHGVSHGYERDHHFNVWFTLATPPGLDAEDELRQISRFFEAEAAFTLPALKLFKLDVYFDMTGNGHSRPNRPEGHRNGPVQLTEAERLVTNEIQDGLPLTRTPFDAMAGRANMGVTEFLTCCRSLLQKGVMRRYSASLNHRKVGISANAMTCWAAPPDKVETAGRELASLREVSHCYERKTNPLWQYNLFAMIHSQTQAACRDVAARLSDRIGLDDCVLLFSTKEFKKSRIKYRV
ncbi:MAG: AsnC family transcriptional regulator [Chloroflexi bacterium]|nr:AsnC family transcriptional regulator [Chloroflexota bacterium]